LVQAKATTRTDRMVSHNNEKQDNLLRPPKSHVQANKPLSRRALMATSSTASTSTSAPYLSATCSTMLCFLLSAIFILHSHVSAADNDNASRRLHDGNNNHFQDIGASSLAESVFGDLVKSSPSTQALVSFWERVRAGPSALDPLDLVLCAAIVLLGFEFLDFVSNHSGTWIGFKRIPVRGKHLDDLSSKDLLFIAISKAATAPFVYCYLRYAFFEPIVEWDLRQATWENTILPLIALFVVFDFFYTLLHGALHIKAIYGWIHKHHHHQKAPSRANVDAVNVHPIEFFLGEYNHLWSLYLVCQVVKLVLPTAKIHIASAMAFLVLGGLLAGWNHTRYDIVWKLPVLNIIIYDSKAHDVHHRIPQSNYGQYTMFWDTLFQTYRPYNPKDRFNPDAQLYLKTGKSFLHAGGKAGNKAQ